MLNIGYIENIYIYIDSIKSKTYVPTPKGTLKQNSYQYLQLQPELDPFGVDPLSYR